jgi:hypothetical protein
VNLRRLLPKRHAKELPIELRRVVKVWNPHGDMLQTHGSKAGWLLWRSDRALDCKCSCGKGGKGGKGNRKLAAGYFTSLLISQHAFNGFDHGFHTFTARNACLQSGQLSV